MQLGRAARALAYVALSIDAHNRSTLPERSASAAPCMRGAREPAARRSDRVERSAPLALRFDGVPQFDALARAAEELAAAMGALLCAGADRVDGLLQHDGRAVRSTSAAGEPPPPDGEDEDEDEDESGALSRWVAGMARVDGACTQLERRLAGWVGAMGARPIAQHAAPDEPAAPADLLTCEAIAFAHVASVASLLLEIGRVRLAHVVEAVEMLLDGGARPAARAGALGAAQRGRQPLHAHDGMARCSAGSQALAPEADARLEWEGRVEVRVEPWADASER